jgi:hypothetical protein
VQAVREKELKVSDEQTNPEASQEEGKRYPLDAFIEHQKRAIEETGKAIESLLPPDFVTHAKEAQKEFVAGFKVLADSLIDELEKVAKKTESASESDDEDKPSTTGKSKVKVQVD